MHRISNGTITNETIRTIDWAAVERRACLRNVPTSRHQCAALLAPGLTARGVWMTDVTFMDRRSVKAQLAGRGDYRVLWWRINQALHHLLRPRASLVLVMYSFHKRHHFLTIASLCIVRDFHAIYQAIRTDGVRSGVHCAIKLYHPPVGE